MPADEYASVGGGLRLKGAKVSKPKKKKNKDKSDLEKNLSTGEEGPSSVALEKKPREPSEEKQGPKEEGSGDERDAPRKTEAEKRFEERKRKKVCCQSLVRWKETVFADDGTHSSSNSPNHRRPGPNF